MVDVFKGYNHNLRIGEGEFYNMTNLTSDDYPVLSPRRKRGVYTIDPITEAPVEEAVALFAKDSLCYVSKGRLYINGYPVQNTEKVNMELYHECDSCPIKSTCEKYRAKSLCTKSLISMGSYIIIMPDKKYVNTINQSDCGNLDASVSATGPVSFLLCKIDGTDYEEMDVGNTAPVSPENMDLWLDTSGETNSLKQYSTTNSQWVSIATTYIKIESEGIGVPFAEGDGVTISGITIEKLQDLNSTMVVHARGDDYIIVTGILDEKIYVQNPTYGKPGISVTRQTPKMDFVIESGNRLWGCRYGVANNGQIVNEIYASKLGDFKNWNTFAGISTDSYVASVGTDGQFTGAITHHGYPLFFKEGCIHKVYGNYPANYQIQTTACRGVQDGCHKSLAIVNETLFYKSRSAVCAYDGSLPVEISSALGDVAYSDAVAGVLGNKYYISMREEDKDDVWHLFVFDTKKGMWHREDDTQATEFCNCRGELYFIDYGDETKTIKTVRGTGNAHESSVKWSAETGIIGTDSPDKKYISRIDVRLLINIGSKVSIYAEYDSLGAWEHVLTMEGKSLRTFAIPVRPKRCDHLRLKIEGSGEAKIFSICKTIAQGSDV
jgi:hypothetical protein